MKKLYIIIFISLSFSAYSQKSVVTNNIEHDIYIGIQNSLEFVVEGYLCKDLSITTDNGTLEKTDNPCIYRIIPENRGLTCITIYKNDAKKTEIGRYNFQTQYLPKPVPVFAGKRKGGDISAHIIKEQSGISTTLEGVGYDAQFPIRGYTITIIHAEDVNVFTRVCKGDKFQPEVIEALNDLKVNDRVIFTDMTYRTIYNTTRDSISTLQSMEIRVIK